MFSQPYFNFETNTIPKPDPFHYRGWRVDSGKRYVKDGETIQELVVSGFIRRNGDLYAKDFVVSI